MNSRAAAGLAALLCLFFAPRAQAGALDAREFTLDNGLRAIVVRESKAPVVVTQVWYRTGGADEIPGKSGVAHMLEHMMFQGTPTVPPGEFSKIISRHGGDDNAATSYDYTEYHVKIAADQLELALKLEADRMRHLLLREDDFKTENLVVREERRSRTDSDPDQRMMEQFRIQRLAGHPYGRPVIGWMRDIEAMTATDMRQWYQRYYAPNNAILVVVGDVEFDQAEALIRKDFGALKPDPNPPRRDWAKQRAALKPVRVTLRDPQAKAPMWMAAATAPTLSDAAQRDDVFALDVLVTLLGDGGSSRLYRSLVLEKGMAISVGASFSGLNLGPGEITLYGLPREGTSIDALADAILDQAKGLATAPIAAREIQAAKNRLLADHVYGQDSIHQTAWMIGRMTISGIPWRLGLEQYPERIRAVTEADLRRVAKRYFNPESMAMGTFLPAAQKPQAQVRSAAEEFPG
ncbi:putative peptidase M16-like protein [Magnetofaba australis IT-1]|uniref:Putative peptidase M16-like protein n=2 Tax=Magnetofaba TaxID=1472292 RepID=A0A1Y2K535_9PROT|nr:putative peptidase M16-like protein [Magnetofaba australis IT-1]